MDLCEKEFLNYKRKGSIKAAKITIKDIDDLLDKSNKIISISEPDLKWLKNFQENKAEAIEQHIKEMKTKNWNPASNTEDIWVGMIGLNPKNIKDRWFIKWDYFLDNYEIKNN